MARILVIDDEPLILEMVQDMLEEAGHEVMTASNSHEGMARFKESPVKLVVTDLFMPEGGGLEGIQMFKTNYPEVKIIVITGIDDRIRDGVMAAAQGLGADRMFAKPLRMADLLAAIDELLAESS